MKILYCSHTTISTSETFLRKTLNFLAENFDALFISSATKAEGEYPCDSIFINAQKKIILNVIKSYLSLVIFSKRKEHSLFDSERKIILNFFKKRKITGDVAVVEYGTSAYKFAPALRQIKIPYVICFHGYDASAYLGFDWYTSEIISIANDALKVIVPSNHLRRRLQLIGVRKDLILVEPCAPEIERLPKHRPGKEMHITSLGRLTSKKSPETLIMSAQLVLERYPNAQFNIIGDGPLMDKCKILVDRLNVSHRVKLLGALNHKQALEKLAEASIFIQHSVTSNSGDQEGFPVAIGEACAMGIPIVSTIHSGITEAVIDGKTGFLVQEHDFEAMAEKIITLIDSANLRREMGKNAANHILMKAPNFQREKVIVNILKQRSHQNFP